MPLHKWSVWMLYAAVIMWLMMIGSACTVGIQLLLHHSMDKIDLGMYITAGLLIVMIGSLLMSVVLHIAGYVILWGFGISLWVERRYKRHLRAKSTAKQYVIQRII